MDLHTAPLLPHPTVIAYQLAHPLLVQTFSPFVRNCVELCHSLSYSLSLPPTSLSSLHSPVEWVAINVNHVLLSGARLKRSPRHVWSLGFRGNRSSSLVSGLPRLMFAPGLRRERNETREQDGAEGERQRGGWFRWKRRVDFALARAHAYADSNILEPPREGLLQ